MVSHATGTHVVGSLSMLDIHRSIRSLLVAKLSSLLQDTVSLALLLHLENLVGKFLVRHLVDGVFRVLALDLLNDLIVVGRRSLLQLGRLSLALVWRPSLLTSKR